METKLFYPLNLETATATNTTVYRAIVDHLEEIQSPQQQEDVLGLFYKREEVGGLEIAENILLPHCESNLFKKSRIFILQLSKPIQPWNDKIKKAELVIALLLKENEKQTVQKRISSFMRKLANEDYLERLQTIEKIEEIERI